MPPKAPVATTTIQALQTSSSDRKNLDEIRLQKLPDELQQNILSYVGGDDLLKSALDDEIGATQALKTASTQTVRGEALEQWREALQPEYRITNNHEYAR